MSFKLPHNAPDGASPIALMIKETSDCDCMMFLLLQRLSMKLWFLRPFVMIVDEGRHGADLDGVGVVSRVLEQAVVRVKEFAWNQEKELSGRAAVIQPVNTIRKCGSFASNKVNILVWTRTKKKNMQMCRKKCVHCTEDCSRMTKIRSLLVQPWARPRSKKQTNIVMIILVCRCMNTVWMFYFSLGTGQTFNQKTLRVTVKNWNEKKRKASQRLNFLPARWRLFILFVFLPITQSARRALGTDPSSPTKLT